jgi:hypothetical protein
VVAGVALAVTGCIGTTDREDFDQIIQERGGGFTSALPLDALQAVAAEVGADDFDIRSMVITAPSETVVLDVRDPAAPGNLDQYVVRQGDVDSVEPIRLSVDDDLEAETFPASEVAFDRLEEMVDQALAEFGRDDAYVSTLSVGQESDSEGVDLVVLRMSLESSRATGSASFTAEGQLVEVVQT